MLPRDVPGYDPALLLRDGREVQFEQERARHWLANRPPPSRQQPVRNSSAAAAAAGPQRKGLAKLADIATALSPAVAPSPATAASSSAFRSPDDLSAFLRLTAPPSTAAVPRSSFPSPTVHTKAAMDDVDAMFADTSSLPLPLATAAAAALPAAASLRPSLSSAFSSASLTSELASATANGLTQQLRDSRARPAAVVFNIHEDTELITPAARRQATQQTQPTAATPAAPTAASFTVFADAAEEDDDDVLLQSDDVIRARTSSAPLPSAATSAAASATPLSAVFRRASVASVAAGLTPILETSRESDASSLSNASTRSSCSAVNTSTRASSSCLGLSVSALPAASSATPAAAASSSSPPVSPFASDLLDPFSSDIQSIILHDLHVRDSDSVTSYSQQAPADVQQLMDGEAQGVDVDVGDLWLRVERRLQEEEGQAGDDGTKAMRVYAVQDMNSSAVLTLRLHRPASLWEHYISQTVAARVAPAAAQAFQLVASSHCYDDLCMSFVPAASTSALLTLSSLLSCYRKRGSAVHPSLITHYTAALLSSLSTLHRASIAHHSLSVHCILLPLDPSASFAAGAEPPSLLLSDWRRAVDLTLLEEGKLTQAVGAAEDAAALLRVVSCLCGGDGELEAERVKEKGGAVGRVLGRLLQAAGGGRGEKPEALLQEAKTELDSWLAGEAGARQRQVKKLLCEQSVMLQAELSS